MTIRIVTDSTCDLPIEFVKEYRIEVVPNILIFGQSSYKDGVDITREEFYSCLSESPIQPTTATASTGSYLNLYNRLFDEGADRILSIHPSKNLSGILNAASSAASLAHGEVTILDSGQLSLGLGFQVLKAGKLAQDNLPVEKIINQLNGIHKRLKLVAMLDTLEYVKRSGRVSWLQASLTSLLKIRALIELKEGKLINLDKVRTRGKAIQYLSNFIHDLGRLENLAILHTNSEEDAIALFDEHKKNSIEVPIICSVTTVIGTHVGPNAVGFAALKVAEES